VGEGVLTLGELLLLMAYLSHLYGPMEQISKKIADLQSSLVSAERSLQVLDESPDVVERTGARAVTRARGEISFENVSFAYEPEKWVLRDLSFKVQPGMRIGIVGPTGVGKTTITHLMMRFYDPVSGAIRLDGTDLRELQLKSLRQQFAVVPQESVLMNASIRDNIAYACPTATRAQIEEAAMAAHAHDFIVRLPNGYDSIVGGRA
jgi:ATP-binding cassette subfamily B protein